MPSDRAVIRGHLDEDTLDRWTAFANGHGITISALLEGMGRHLPEGNRLPRFLRDAVTEARAVQIDRKDRRPPD